MNGVDLYIVFHNSGEKRTDPCTEKNIGEDVVPNFLPEQIRLLAVNFLLQCNGHNQRNQGVNLTFTHKESFSCLFPAADGGFGKGRNHDFGNSRNPLHTPKRSQDHFPLMRPSKRHTPNNIALSFDATIAGGIPVRKADSVKGCHIGTRFVATSLESMQSPPFANSSSFQVILAAGFKEAAATPLCVSGWS